MNIDLAFFWKLFWRRLPVMTLLVLIFSSVGVITAVKLPETWSTSARLLAEAPQIPDDMVNSTVQTDAVEQLDIIQQRLLTRANMIDIANRFNVFENIRRMEPDRVYEEMRKATTIKRTAGRNLATLLTLSFTARSGTIAANVVNEYVTIVLDENARFRLSRAENTLDFFNQEVARLADELDSQSAAIAVFKTENAAALPEDQSYRLGRQTLLQERLGRLERALTAAKSQREQIIRLFERTGGVELDETKLSPEEERLNQVRTQIDLALLMYSETHPRILQLRNTEQALEERLQSRLETTQADDVAQDDVAQDDVAESSEPVSTESALLEASLSELNNQVALAEQDIEETTAALQSLQSSITQSSANGIQLAALERDYDNIQARYNVALNNLNTAAMSERIETRAQGQRISVIENANVPSVPTGPNRPKIAIVGAALGFLSAIGYFFLLEFLNRTVRRPNELINRFNVVPIATIPFMENRKHRMMRRAGIVATTLAVLISVPAGLWYIDQNFLPLEVVVQKGLSQLGLG